MSTETEQKSPSGMTPESQQKSKPKKLEVSLPYMASAGTIKTAMERIRSAALPERVHVDFVNTILQMKGGSGGAVPSFLKRLGFVNPDGSPSQIYKQFRNTTTGGTAMATAIKNSYKPLGDVREYFYKLGDKELLSLIIQVTGADLNSSSAKQILYTLNALKEFANFDQVAPSPENALSATPLQPVSPPRYTPDLEDSGLKLNLAYTINLNLPATSDQSVFNAIFRSLKEHLLSYGK